MRMGCATVLVGLVLGSMTGTAQASYLFQFSQVGKDVVLTGSGEINTSILRYNKSVTVLDPGLEPDISYVQVGPSGDMNMYKGIDGPAGFGGSQFSVSSSSSGNLAYMDYSPGNFSDVGVSTDYISGTFMSGSTTFAGATFKSLQLDPGTYTYNYSGRAPLELAFAAHAAFSVPTISDSIVVQIGPVSPVPLPASAPMFGAALIGLAGVGYAAKRKKAASAA